MGRGEKGRGGREGRWRGMAGEGGKEGKGEPHFFA